MKQAVPSAIGRMRKALAAAVVVAAASTSAIADDFTWTGANGTDWCDVLNWQGGLLPGDGGIVFGAGATGKSVIFTNEVVVAGPLAADGADFTFSAEPQVIENVTEIPAAEEGGDPTYEYTYETNYVNGLSVSNAFNLATTATASATFARGSYYFGTVTNGSASAAGSLVLDETDGFSVGGDFALVNGLLYATNASVNVGEYANFAFQTSANGTVDVVKESGDWTVGGNLYVGRDAGDNVKASFVHNGGTLTVGRYFCLGKNEKVNGVNPEYSFTLNDGVVNVAGEQPLLVGDWGVPTGKYQLFVNGGEFNVASYVALSGSDKNGGKANGEIYVSNGVFNVSDSIQFSRGSSTAENRMLLALAGGTVKAKNVRYATDADAAGSSRLGLATVLFDGGTLAAAAAGELVTAHENLSVVVGANGGTVDTAGYNVSFGEDISTADGLATDGGLKLVGGGKFTMNGAANYKGRTTLVLPTRIEVPTAAAKDAILADGGLYVDLSDAVLPVGRCNVLTITGGDTCAAADLAKCTCSDPSVVFELSEDQKSICVVFPASEGAFVWTGSADGNFSTPANWIVNKATSDIAPTNGAEVVFMTDSPVTATLDYDLSVSKLIFAAGYAQVTIANSADEKLTLAQNGVMNYSDHPQILDLPVEYMNGASWANITYSGTRVEYWGGVTGNLPTHAALYGHYTLKATSWGISSAITLKENSTVTATGLSLTLNGNNLLNAESGTEMTLKELYLKGEGNAFGSFKGDMTVGNVYSAAPTRGSFNDGFKGTLTVGHYRGQFTSKYVNENNRHVLLRPAGDIVVKGSGLECYRGKVYIGQSGRTTVFRSASNWNIYTTKASGWAATGQVTDGFILDNNSVFAIDTSDVGGGDGHKVRVYNNNANTSLYPNRISGTGAIAAFGDGELAFESNCSFSGGLTASNGVTVSVNGGVRPCNCDIAVKETARLTVKGTTAGGAQIPKKLALEAGSTLNLAACTAGYVPMTVGSGVTLPTGADTAALTKDGGAFGSGVYPVYKKSGLSADDVSAANTNLKPVLATEIPYEYVALGDTLYLVVDGGDEYVWVGGADGNFNVASNWRCGRVPGEGANVYFWNDSDATVENGIEGFAPASVTYLAESASITIDGNAMSNVGAVTNLASVSHTVNAPVYFAGDIQVKQAAMAELDDLAKTHVTFAGGAYAAPGCAIESGSASAVHSRVMFGNYYLDPAEGSPWTAVNQTSSRRPMLADGSTLAVPYAQNLTELYIGAGSAVTAGVVKVTADTSIGHRLCWQNFGEYVVTNEVVVSGTGGKKDEFAGWSAGTGASNVFKIEKATCTRTDGWTLYFAEGNAASHGTFYFGKGGLNFGTKNGYFGFGVDKDGDAQTVRPWYGDFTMERGAGNSNHDIWMNRDVTFNTDDESGIGRTITLNARVKFNKTPTFTVAGTGKVVVNGGAAADSAVAPIAVTDSATLAFNEGTTLGKGSMTVASGATLAALKAGENTVAVGDALTLAAGSTVAISNVSRKVAAVSAKSLVLPESGKVSLPVSGKLASNGDHVLIATTEAIDGWQNAAGKFDYTGSFEDLPQGATVEFVVEEKAVKLVVAGLPEFPAGWNDGKPVSDEIVSKFNDWKDQYGLDANDIAAPGAETDFLLGQDPKDETRIKTLGVTAIDVIDGETKTVTLTSTHDLSKANGYVYVLLGAEPKALVATALEDAGMDAATPAALDAGDGRKIAGLGAGDAARLFRIGVGYADYSKETP